MFNFKHIYGNAFFEILYTLIFVSTVMQISMTHDYYKLTLNDWTMNLRKFDSSLYAETYGKLCAWLKFSTY